MRRSVICVIVALLVLASAGTALAAWHQPVGGPSPINEAAAGHAGDASLAEINGVPYLAWRENDGTNVELRVARLNAAGTAWELVGNSDTPINQSSARNAAAPSLTEIDGVPYIAWSENDGTNGEIRVARLNAAGTAWEKVGQTMNPASPINRIATDDARNPSLIGINGLPYVAWQEFDGANEEIRVATLNASRTGWDRVGTSLDPNSPINVSGTRNAFEPSLTAISGVPYVAWRETDGTNYEMRVARLNAAATGWEKVLDSSSPINRVATRDAQDPSLIPINGVPYVAWSENDGSNYEVRVARPNAANTGWERIGTSLDPESPINNRPDRDGFGPSLTAINGLPYVAWEEFDDANYEIRVARLNATGSGWEKVAGSSSPINESSGGFAETASLSAINGIPFVAWDEGAATGFDQVRVSRLEPEFVSQSVANVSATTADLTATWHTYGIAYPIGFEFGPALESATAPTAATLADTSTVTQQLSGLPPSTAYEYRSFALAGAEPRLLADTQGFTTAAAPVVPDTTPPETTITKDPPNKLKKSKAKYKFTSNEPGSSFVCKFDKKKPKSCDAGKHKLKRLDAGKHKFRVYAVDTSGNQDPSPARDKFKVRR
jgi:hypothetical protein